MVNIKTIEIVIRGNIIEKNIIWKLGQRLRDSKLQADFSSTIMVPPFIKAYERDFPSLAILYGTVVLEELFQFKALVEEVCASEDVEVITLREL